jgi:hypothetical protein
VQIRTRPPKAGSSGRRKGPGFGLTASLALCLGASLTLALALPSAAGACARPGSVKSFHGHAHMQMAVGASGEDPGLGGTETVFLERDANLQLNLNEKLMGRHGAAIFGGKITGGSGSVGDAIENSGSGYEGNASFGGSLSSHHPNFGSAEVILTRRGCKYQVLLDASMRTTYSGDEALKPGLLASISATSDRESIPHTLQLSDHNSLAVYLGCPASLSACFEFGGTWTTDFATLKLCHSVTAEHCTSDKKPVGSATIGWSLSPIFKKHYKP